MPSVKEMGYLVIDDETSTLQTIAAFLAAEGATDVVTARDASTGAVMLESGKHSIDCIICDHMLELLSGLDLLRLIRSAKLKGIPPDLCFILVTGFGTIEVSSAAKVLDANAYLAKPITRDELAKAIRRGIAFRPTIRAAKEYASLQLPIME